jgi:CRISPR system Cascade subunit CasA
MSISFNLIDERWIPCLRANGARDELGLHDVLMQAHQLRDIRGDTALETAALYRLLLAVLHRVFGPKGRSEWITLWKQEDVGFDVQRLEKYLLRSDVYSRFDLFHPQRPFYQALDVRAGKKSIISMVLQMASGNNATLFDHHTEQVGVALTPAQAARALITSQGFGFGGLSGLPEKFTDAPCAKGIIFFAAGENLFETLMLNLVCYYEDEPIPCLNADDCPAWEMDDPFLPNRQHPKGYLDYLTWHNRRIWLYPEISEQGVVVRQMSWAPGLRLDSEDIDPMKQYIADDQEGFRVLCFQPDRALWRDSAVLLRLGDNNKHPRIVGWLADLSGRSPKALEENRQYRLMALGLAKSRASLDFLRAESLPLPIEFLANEGFVSDLSTAIEFSEKTGKLLNRCAFLLAWLIHTPSTPDKNFDELDQKFDEQTRIDDKITRGRNDKSKDREAQQVYRLFSSFGVERLYWSQLEAHFHRLIQDLPDDPETAKENWRAHLKRVAHGAFNQAIAYAGADRRAQRAIVKAEEQFRFGLAQILNVKQTDSLNGGETNVPD